ncbi:hypothetical protein Pfo_006464 [Paulownia fortunei]|nr:hypothetical protein Pfo_006464 [Paulownia fortunei]
MTTKMKGLFKGLRYISQIFEEDREQEMQIGFPTDVKHVAHIGMDGPSVDSPSWRGTRAINSPGRDLPEVPRSSRRHHSAESNSNESPRMKDSSTKSRQTRRHHSKDSSEGSVKTNRQLQESSQATDSPPRSLPDITKKSRRKKSKESVIGGGSTRSRSKPATSSGTCTSTYSDPGPDTESILQTSGSQSGPIPSILDEEKERGVISKEY